LDISAGISEQSMGERNQVVIGLSYWPDRLHRLAESIPGLFKSLKIQSQECLQLAATPRASFCQKILQKVSLEVLSKYFALI
jgi:hypothetical protein